MKEKKDIMIILVMVVLAIIPEGSFAQKKGKYGATPEDSIKCVENLSLYIEFYKQKNYNDAIIGWRWVFNNCPKSSKKMYADGASMYKKFAKKEKDPIKKGNLIDTLMIIYDQRIENFKQEGFVLGMKGEAYMQFRKEGVDEAYKVLKKSVSLQGNKSKAGPLTAYFQSTILMLEQEKVDKGLMIETFGKISGIIDYQLSILKDEKKRSFYISAKENIEILFGPIASCEDLIKLYTSRYEENKENIDWLKRSTALMAKKSCTNDPLFVTLAETLNRLQPSAESAYNISKMLIDKGQHNKAATYLKEAIDLQEDEEKKAGYYMTLANHAFKNLGQKTQARTYAQKAINTKPSWGEPYLAIGDYYAASSKECGTNDFEKAAVYWVSVDKYKKAKAIDPSCADVANKKIATWSKYFPNQKDAFFYGFNDGKPYSVGCWINETTTVRVQ
ncbi:MAG TPA: hypothetical protein EYM84_00125 [Flavobacteriales bacterium]|nr:hypothetical protein [Flavobacteriales bacterium]